MKSRKPLRYLRARLFGAPIVIIHEFHKPPYGGGNQFLLALMKEWQKKGIVVGRNRVGRDTRVVLFNSFNFNFGKLRQLKRAGLQMIHRVDGPISKYRGKDEQLDANIHQINIELADKTVFQSKYSYDAHLAMGLDFRNPTIIPNACDSNIFFQDQNLQNLNEGEKIHLISTSWSDNPKKGLDTYTWLDKHLDFTKFDYTFVGRCQADFENIQKLDPVDSTTLAGLLRRSHLYIAPSINDPCSNALIEALSCGLPAVFKNSGGHSELVKDAGYGFDKKEQIPVLLENMIKNYKEIRSKINVSGIDEVAQKYYDLMEY